MPTRSGSDTRALVDPLDCALRPSTPPPKSDPPAQHSALRHPPKDFECRPLSVVARFAHLNPPLGLLRAADFPGRRESRPGTAQRGGTAVSVTTARDEKISYRSLAAGGCDTIQHVINRCAGAEVNSLLRAGHDMATLSIKLWSGMKTGQLCPFGRGRRLSTPYGSLVYGSRYQDRRGANHPSPAGPTTGPTSSPR
jgi:hypothetical protein